jgi:uncharacterized protein YbbC (DUF1343 family)
MYKLTFIILLTIISVSCTGKQKHIPIDTTKSETKHILCGAEQTEKYINKLQDKNIGILANNTSRIGNIHIVDSLKNRGVKIKAIFAPEHGFRGKADAGELVKDGIDPKTGIKVYSLYGENREPNTQQLENIDLMIFDVQDVGARFYTYISSMHYLMEACAENGIPLLILDRPNPNGDIVDGPVLDTSYRSFVGMHPVPIAHGMTIAEYALMINGEGWLKNSVKCKLDYIACENYTHKDSYSLPYMPSPNLPNDRSIELYPSLCLFEATTISIGRGTDMQFQIIGHPLLKGIADFQFTPNPNSGSKYPKHEGEVCFGYDLKNKNERFIEHKGQINLSYILYVYNEFPDKSNFFKSKKFFDKLAGTDKLRKQIIEGKLESKIRESWKNDLTKFKNTREKYLIYN